MKQYVDAKAPTQTEWIVIISCVDIIKYERGKEKKAN